MTRFNDLLGQALSIIFLVYLWLRQRFLTLLNILPFLLLCVSTVYLGWHYVIDIPAGALLGVIAILITRRTLNDAHIRLEL